jgi:hypothetical protein
MDTPADLTLKVTLPPFSGNAGATWISVMPGYESGQRLASLSNAIVSAGDALISTLRCTSTIGLLALSCVAGLRGRAGVSMSGDLPSSPAAAVIEEKAGDAAQLVGRSLDSS